MEASEKKRSAQFWADHIRRWTASGLSRRRYCNENGLSYWTFREWQKRQSKGVNGGEGLVRLPRAIITGDATFRSSIEIVLPGSITIRVTRGFDAELLRDLIRELGVWR